MRFHTAQDTSPEWLFCLTTTQQYHDIVELTVTNESVLGWAGEIAIPVMCLGQCGNASAPLAFGLTDDPTFEFWVLPNELGWPNIHSGDVS
jgi:hypothetical protein